MLIAPSGIRPFEQIHQPFALLRLVAVIVDADDVAEVIEGDLLRVPDAVGVDFEARPIGFAAKDRTLMREDELPTFFARHVASLVADRPIDATIGSEAESVHVVTRIGDMSAEAGSYEFLYVRDTVAVGILEAPDVRDGGQVDPAVEIQHAGRDAGNRGVKAFGVDGDLVRDAVLVGVGELVDGLLRDPEVLPVDRAILVVILESAARGSQLARRQFALEQSQLFCR